MNAKTTLDQVTCARFPSTALSALAGLRRVEGISVLEDGDLTWVFWENHDDRVLRSLFPVEGVDFFERRGGSWYRLGRRLPFFEIPDRDRSISLDRAIFPETFQAERPGATAPPTFPLRLVRDSRRRPSSASLCNLTALAHWADTAPAHAIESIRGAIQGDQALLLGRSLPVWPGATRYWGERVLVPIGFQVRPCLSEAALLESLTGSGLEVIRFIAGEPSGEGSMIEGIPFDAFRPLTRASIRLAARARTS